MTLRGCADPSWPRHVDVAGMSEQLGADDQHLRGQAQGIPLP